MIRGFYAAVSGMVATFNRAQIISNNLANLGTVGYKEDVNTFRAFRSMLFNRMDQRGPEQVGRIGTGIEISPTTLKLDQGSLRFTGNPLDVAVQGPGFFAIQTATGTSYTRTSHLYRDVSGQLVTADGARVLGEAGPIVLPVGDPQFAPDGTLLVNGVQVDKLQLVEFTNPNSLRKEGTNRYGSTDAPVAPANTGLHMGFVEESNVDPTKAMTDLLMVHRAYEASQKLTQLNDDTLRSAVNEVGRVG